MSDRLDEIMRSVRALSSEDQNLLLEKLQVTLENLGPDWGAARVQARHNDRDPVTSTEEQRLESQQGVSVAAASIHGLAIPSDASRDPGTMANNPEGNGERDA